MLFSDESYCRWRRYLVLLSYLMEELTLVHSASRKSVTRLPEGTGIVDNWLARKQVLSDSPAALRKPPSLSNVFALVPVRAGIISSLTYLALQGASCLTSANNGPFPLRYGSEQWHSWKCNHARAHHSEQPANSKHLTHVNGAACQCVCVYNSYTWSVTLIGFTT